MQVAAFNGFPPFFYKENGLIVGKDLQLLNKFCDKEKLTCVFKFYEFDHLWHLPRDEYVDVACGGLSNFKHRDTIWSEPYAEVRRSALILRSNQPYLKQYSDFRKFGVVKDSAAHFHALKHIPIGREIRFLSSIDEGIELLLDGTIEGIGTGSISAYHQLKKWEFLHVLDLHQAIDYPEQISFAVRNNSLLLSKLNHFILELFDYQI